MKLLLREQWHRPVEEAAEVRSAAGSEDPISDAH